MGKTGVYILKVQDSKGIESRAAERASRHLIGAGNEKDLELFEIDGKSGLQIKDLAAQKDCGVFILIYGHLYISRDGIKYLSEITGKSENNHVVVPVSNESRVSLQRQKPPFYYQTLAAFRWAVRETYGRFKDRVVETGDADDFCFAFKRETLERLPADCLLTDLPGILKKKRLKVCNSYGSLCPSLRQ